MRTLIFVFVMLVLGNLHAQNDNELFSSIESKDRLTNTQIKLVKGLSGEESLDLHQFVSINPHALLFDNIVLNIHGIPTIFNKQNSEKINDVFIWEGAEKKTNGYINLKNTNGVIRGEFYLNEIRYLIYPITASSNFYGILNVTKISNTHEKCTVPHNLEEHISELTTESRMMGANECKVRILVVFTDDVFSEVDSPEDLRNNIEAAIDEVNIAYYFSQISHRVELARIVGINYDESHNNMNTALDYMRNSNLINSYRSKYEADVVLTILNFGTGLAYVRSSASSAHGVVNYDYMVNNKSLAHELGHIYGAQHDIRNDNTTHEDNDFTYNHGYNAVDEGVGNWHTIMSYHNSCGCPRIDRFSNPYVSYSGINTGTTGNNNNTRVLNERAEIVANFRTCDDHEILSDILGGPSDYAHVYAGDEITTNGTFRVTNGAKAIFQAPNGMKLNSGFKIEQGGTFKTVLQSCGSPINSLINEEESQEIGKKNRHDIFSNNTLSVNPNPLKGSGTIIFGLDKKSTISIAVFDINGKNVASIIENQYTEKGNHELELNLVGLPNGQYFCTLQTETDRKVSKIILLE